MYPHEVLEKLSGTSSRLEKEAIILEAWNSNCIEFFKGCILAYDNLVTFGVATVPLIEGEDEESFVSEFNWTKFEGLVTKLINRTLTGHAARDAIRTAASECSIMEWNNWYRRILLKDLRAGITETTINKVLKTIGNDAKRFSIAQFPCQLAHDADNHLNKLKGPKMVDIKLDGTRILTVLDKERNLVSQFTRNGKENKNFSGIIDSLQLVLNELPGSVVLDGEMISENFQELMTQLNRKKDVDTSEARLALFDIIPLIDFRLGFCEISQRERHTVLVALESLLQQHTEGKVFVIPKLLVNLDTDDGQKRFKDFCAEAANADIEGVMLKDPASPYENKRTSSWLKKKPFITLDVEIVECEEGTGKNAGRLGNLICRGKFLGQNIKVSVGSGFSDEQRIEFWTNKETLAGQIIEIEADKMSKNKAGEHSLRFPRFIRFRELVPGEGKI